MNQQESLVNLAGTDMEKSSSGTIPEKSLVNETLGGLTNLNIGDDSDTEDNYDDGDVDEQDTLSSSPDDPAHKFDLDRVLRPLNKIFKDEETLELRDDQQRIVESAFKKLSNYLDANNTTTEKNVSRVNIKDIGIIASTVALYLNRYYPRQVTATSAVLLVRLIELDSAEVSLWLTDLVEDLLTEDSLKSMIVVFSMIGTLFHLDSAIASKLFSIEELQTHQFSKRHFLSEKVVISALEALSAACVDSNCRALVTANFEPLMKAAFEGNTANKLSVRLLAGSILVKTKGTAKLQANNNKSQEETVKFIQQASTVFEEATATLLTSGDGREFYGVALEGLAYTTLLTDIKDIVIKNKQIIKNLIEVITSETNEQPWVYCALTTLANLTQYPPALTEEQQKLNQLRDYAGKSALGSENNQQKDRKGLESHATMRCQVLLEAGLCTALSKSCNKYTTKSRETAASILRNLVTDKYNRPKVLEQGGAKVIVYLLEIYGKKSKDTEPLEPIYTVASSALAKLLITTEPSLVLSSKYSMLNFLPPLVHLLQSSSSHSELPLLDAFESLLALTNIASVDDKSRDVIVSKTWTILEQLWTGNNIMLQRASVELICNLAMSPLCAERFLDGSKTANGKLELLAFFTDSEDIATQCAAAGALAMLSEWDPAAPVMSKCKKLIEKLSLLLRGGDDAADRNEDLLLRAIVTVRNIVCGEDPDLTYIKEYNIESQLRPLLSSSDAETVQLVKETLEELQSASKE